jgi:hypothetical protein
MNRTTTTALVLLAVVVLVLVIAVLAQQPGTPIPEFVDSAAGPAVAALTSPVPEVA